MRIAHRLPEREVTDHGSDEFARALVAGLSARPRRLSPRWLYDRRGSGLFERICELPEYYPTRTELGLLEQFRAEIGGMIGPRAVVVDFGAGSLRKARHLIAGLDEPMAYWPVDVSEGFLRESADRWRRELPHVPVDPVVADFTADFVLPDTPSGARRVGFYPGSSIGNLEPDAARGWLERMRACVPGGLLVGVDLVKEPAVLRAAYNDAAGVTAAFNLNLWRRANREAGADFDIDHWRHLAFYNRTAQRIEMHLVSRRPQRVQVAGSVFEFAAGDTVHTESSYKYSIDGFQALATQAGWQATRAWVDGARRFSLHWLRLGD